jgi:hypothetical protein
METRLSRAEFWLLNCAVYSDCPLSFLPEPGCLTVFNKIAGHGLAIESLVKILAGLFDRGWIAAHRLQFGTREDKALNSMPEDAIRNALHEQRPLRKQPYTSFVLTPLGAAIWEEFAAPQWDRYIDYADQVPGEFVGASEWRIRKYFGLVQHLGIEVLPETVVWDEIRPWNATYWKTLPVGYRVQFEYQNTNRPTSWDSVPGAIESLRRFYDWE